VDSTASRSGTQLTRPAGDFIVQASLGRSRPEGWGVRFDVFDEQFGGRLGGVLATMAVAGVSASVFKATQGHSIQMFEFLGPQAYYFYRHPTVQGAVRPGLSVGFGLAWALRRRGSPSLCFEFRFSSIFGEQTQRVLTPITLGIRF
jgi:hypothetical protein